MDAGKNVHASFPLPGTSSVADTTRAESSNDTCGREGLLVDSLPPSTVKGPSTFKGPAIRLESVGAHDNGWNMPDKQVEEKDDTSKWAISRSVSSPSRMSSADQLNNLLVSQTNVTRPVLSLPPGQELLETSLESDAQLALYGVAPRSTGPGVPDVTSRASRSASPGVLASLSRKPRHSPSIQHAQNRNTAVRFMISNVFDRISSEGKNSQTLMPPGEGSLSQGGDQKGKSKSFHNLLQNKVKDVCQMTEATTWMRMKKQMSFYGHHVHGADHQVPWLTRVLEPDDPFVVASASISFFMATLDVVFVFIAGASFSGCPQCGNPYTDESAGTRGHLGPTVWWLKLVLGLISDVAAVNHVALQFRVSADAAMYTRSSWEDKRTFRRHVRYQYLTGQFALDALAAAPLYWIWVQNPWVRLNRLLRFVRVRVTGVARVWGSLTGLNINMQLVRILNFLLLLAFWVHMMACCTMVVAWRSLDSPAGAENVALWFAQYDETVFEDWGRTYLQAQLWTCSVVAGFGGEWAPQTPGAIAWTLGNSIVGVFMLMYIFGEIVSALQNFDLTAAEFNSKRDMVTTFLQIRGVPKETRIRVHKYFDTLWNSKHGMEERQVLSSLPSFLASDVAWQLNSVFLEKVPMFLGADPAALMEINKYLVHSVATAGEFVVRNGEICSEMHFVIGGCLHILDESGEMESELYEGSVVGEVSVLLDMPAPHDIQAKTACDFLTLSLDSFTTVAEAFPGLRFKLEQRACVVYGRRWREWRRQQELEGDAEEDGGAPTRAESAESAAETKPIKFTPRSRRSSIDNTAAGEGLGGHDGRAQHLSTVNGPAGDVSDEVAAAAAQAPAAAAASAPLLEPEASTAPSDDVIKFMPRRRRSSVGDASASGVPVSALPGHHTMGALPTRAHLDAPPEQDCSEGGASPARTSSWEQLGGGLEARGAGNEANPSPGHWHGGPGGGAQVGTEAVLEAVRGLREELKEEMQRARAELIAEVRDLVGELHVSRSGNRGA